MLALTENVTEIVKQLYVDEAAAVILDEMVLDGGVDAEGNIEFAVGQQA